jgi:hypothetical protein
VERHLDPTSPARIGGNELIDKLLELETFNVKKFRIVCNHSRSMFGFDIPGLES